MLKYLEKYRTLIAIILVLILLIIFLFLPIHMQLASRVMLVASIGMAMALISQKHWQYYKNAECTHEKTTRNLSLDLLGLLLAMAAAIFAGGQAGQWAGVRTGLWAGSAAGVAAAMLCAGLVGFLAAKVVRSVWGRVVKLV